MRASSIVAAGCMIIAAAGASANCWEPPIEGASVQAAEISVHRGNVVIGFPNIGRAFVVGADLSEVLELRPLNGDAFDDGVGFDALVALFGDIAAIGAVRIGSNGPGVKQPAGIFIAGAVSAFSTTNDALLWHVESDSKWVLGHSVSVDDRRVAFGVFEAPGQDGGSVRLRDAAPDSIALRSRHDEPLRVIAGPPEGRGFGADLSDQAPIISTAPNADALEIWTLSDEKAIQVASLSATLNGIPATHLAVEASIVAISAGGGFSADARRSL